MGPPSGHKPHSLDTGDAVQVQEARTQGGAYGGEATGIKAGVAKSRRFGS